uniref:Uncharacterized protein n=1 Tax=Oryza brachyantha TaxID=4533 RepID=J3MMT4_ORYBR
AVVAMGFIAGATATALVGVGAVCLMWPVAAPLVMMTAPGGAGLLISRLAFEANPRLYYQLLRTAGPAAAAAAFAA